MNPTLEVSLNLNGEEVSFLAELLEAERVKLLVEIRRTDHRVFREGLRRRLELVENLAEHCHTS